MTLFILTVGIAIAVSTIGKLMWFVDNDFPCRTPKNEAMDIVINIALLIWIAVLLSK